MVLMPLSTLGSTTESESAPVQSANTPVTVLDPRDADGNPQPNRVNTITHAGETAWLAVTASYKIGN